MPWLKENKGVDVVACLVDVGRMKDVDVLVKRALARVEQQHAIERDLVAGGEVVVEPLLWTPLRGGMRDALVEAVDAYGAFLGRPARLA